MLITADTTSPKKHQGRTIFLSVAALAVLFLWESLTCREDWSLLAMFAVVLAFSFAESSVMLPFVGKQLRYYHLIYLGTFFWIGPSNANLVAMVAFSWWLFRTYRISKMKLVEKLPDALSSLAALWLMGKVFILNNSLSEIARYGSLLPIILVVTGYYLCYSLFRVTAAKIFRGASLGEEWKKEYRVPSLVFLSVSVAVGLLNFFAGALGNQIYLLFVPFSLFALSTYKVYSSRLVEASRQLKEHSQLQMSIIETLALAIDAKDHSTHGHARRVQVYAVGIAKSMGIENSDDLDALRAAALLHDIGKLAIPEYILSKPGSLTDSEFAKMTRHVEIGANILEPIHFPYPVVPMIRYHHERENGSGYPYGLKGDQIPIGSKILAVADTFDALTAQRTYRTPLTSAEAIDLLKNESGMHYDAKVVAAFLRVSKELMEEVAMLDISKYGNNTHLSETSPDSAEDQKLLLRKKGFTEIASTHREIYALHEIFQTVGKSLNLDDTLRIICSKLQSIVPFTSSVVYLKNKKTDMIYPAMVTGEYSEQLSQNWMALGEGLTGYSIAFNQPVVNNDPTNDFKNLAFMEKPHQLTNAMIFPLTAKNTVLGAIALYSTDRDNEPFTEDHSRLMETISERAAVAIQNAISFEYFEENSLTDPLTGLPNSRYMFMAFDQNVKKAERSKEKMAILVMDLNRFKEINDQYGHKVGDDVLVKVSEVLQKEMRKYDTCIRYAGDEFVAFLYNAERETAEKIASRIRKSIHSLLLKVRSGKEVRLGISVGISMYPHDGTDLNHLFTVADSQMYTEKFEAKAELANANGKALADSIQVDDDIEFQRAN